MDKFTKLKRSEIMSHVKQENTAVEMAVRRLLHSLSSGIAFIERACPANPI
ncbi:hypothetical protein ABXY91_002663 [Vibrio fluvialis]